MLFLYKYIISLLAIGILYYYAVALYGIPQDKKRMAVFILVTGSTTGMLMILESYIGIGLRGFLVTITMILGTYLMLKLKIMQALICSIIYFISMSVGDTFVVILLVKLYGYSAQQVKSSILLSITADLIIYGTSIIILLFIMTFMQPKELADRLNRRAQFKTSVYMFFTVIVIVINYALNIQFIRLINYKLVLVNLVLIWVYLILSLYINFTARELAVKEQQYNQQQDYIKTIDNLINDFRRLRHNHNNTLYSISGYIEESDWEGLKGFFAEIMDETRRSSNNNTLLALQKIKVYSLFGLLWAKVDKAESLGIRMDVEVSDEITEINMRKSDLSELLGNYLDNALEGAQHSEGRKIKVSILEDEDYINFIVSNTYDGELDIGKITERGYSTKGEGRGYGLAITEALLAKYKHVLHNTTFDNGIFNQEISIKKQSA